MDNGKDNLLPKCIACESTPPGGINDGILICRKFLCTACEEDIIKTPIEDSNYLRHRECLKKMWY
ncbi:MAG: hypothetical protein GX318_01205 [Clostridia bacterium]|nr:hypothetical protein [Clostridia bacterium]